MLRKRKRGKVAMAFVVGEAWLTIAEVIMAARQSIQVNMLCQRPIHTHSSMSVAKLISSHVLEKESKKHMFSPKPFLLVQWPERLYQHFTVQRPPNLKLTDSGAVALLADAGFNSREWRWDMLPSQTSCHFLLMKVTDYHEYYQALCDQHCPPDLIGFVPRPDNFVLSTAHIGVWPDIASVQQAIHFATQFLTGHQPCST